MMEPVITALKQQYGDELTIIIADFSSPGTAQLAAELGVQAIPAFFFFNGEGVLVARGVGALSMEELVKGVRRAIGDEETPVEPVTGDSPGWADSFPDVVGQRSVLAFVLVLAAGILTSVSPCILAMIPLLVGYIGGYQSRSRVGGFVVSAIFVGGMALTFSLLGFAASTFGRVFAWTGQLWTYLFAAVAVLMGLQLLGVLVFDMPGLKRIPLKKSAKPGILGMGMLFGLVASPCATPVLALIVTYSAMQAGLLYGSALLFTYGLGHGLPLLAAGTFTGIAGRLPRFGCYTRYISQAAGLIMVSAGLILLAGAVGLY